MDDINFFWFFGIFFGKTSHFCHFFNLPGKRVENKRGLEVNCSHFALSWRSVTSKMADFKILSIFGYFGGKNLRFCPFTIFLGNQEKSVEYKSCKEFYCGHFELS